MKFDYFSKASSNYDMKMASSVKAFIFPSYIEATGVTYTNHKKTKGELMKEMEELKNLPLSVEEYEKRVSELQQHIEQRTQIHPP